MPTVDFLELGRSINYSTDRPPFKSVPKDGSPSTANGAPNTNLLLVSQRPISSAELLNSGLNLLGINYPAFGADHFRVVSCPYPDTSKIADAVTQHSPTAIVLEPFVPNGLTLVRSIREIPYPLPLIIVNRRVAYRDSVVDWLNAGADQYIDYPFTPSELAAIVVATIRRDEWIKTPPPITDTKIYYSEDRIIKVDPNKWEVTKDDKKVHVRPTGMRVLLELAQELGDFTAYEHLAKQLGYRGGRDESSMTHVRVVIRGLRRKLEDDPQNPKLITTVTGRGYKAHLT